MVRRVGAAGILPRGPPGHGQALLHRLPPAERHRLPPHGARVQLHHPGHPHPLQADGRLQHALAVRYRPRRHRDPVRRGAAARRGGQEQGRPRARGLPGPRVEVEGGVGRHHRQAAQAPRRVLRLGARALHHGRGALRGGARGVRSPLGRGAHLPRRLHRQLVPALPDRAVRPRGGARGARRRVRLHQVRAAHPRHRAARDQARRHRGRRASQGPAVPEVRGQDPRDSLGRGEHLDPGRRRHGGGSRSSAPA